jgi:hypothetical protein
LEGENDPKFVMIIFVVALHALMWRVARWPLSLNLIYPSLPVVEELLSVDASSFVSLSFHPDHFVHLPETSIRAKEYS